MSRALSYFRLQLKRFFKLMPVILLLSALLICAIGAAFIGVFSESESDEQNSLINIGVVGDPDDSYLSMAISALRNLDSSRFSLAVQPVEDEETAAEMIRRGDLVAYIVLPDNFIREAIAGNVQKIACVTASGATDFGTQITNELMMTITQIVQNSQKTVYGFQNAALASGVDDDKTHAYGTEVAFDVINLILKRESAYQIEELGTAGGDAVNDTLICGMLILLLMLWGITCCTIFTARNSTLDCVLSSKGTGAAVQVLSEYFAYLIFMIATFTVFTVVIYILSPLFPAMPLLEKYDFNNLVPGVILPLFTISSMQFFLYEVTKGLVTGVLLQFFVAMGLGYISGCIYPAYLFSRGLQDTASYLPAWSCRLWLDELLAGKPSLKTLLVMAAFFIGFLLLSVLIRHVRIRRGGGAA